MSEHRVITWSTAKTATGYRYRVYSFAYQAKDIELKIGECATRAQATLRAKRWTMIFKHEAKKAA